MAMQIELNGNAIDTKAADKAIAAQFAIVGKSKAAMVTIGLYAAMGAVGGAYAGDDGAVAAHAYGLRVVDKDETPKSVTQQTSKLKNFVTVGRGWDGMGVKVIERLNALTEGRNGRYETTQTVLVKIKALLKSTTKPPVPTDEELTAFMVSEAKPERSPADEMASIMASLGKFGKENNYPEAVASAYQHLETYAPKLGLTSAEIKQRKDKTSVSENMAKARAEANK